MPANYEYFAFISLLAAISVMQLTVSEIVSCLSTISICLNLSRETVSITLLPWGNCIGDLIVNLYLTRLGYYRSADAACYGGPIFSNYFRLFEFVAKTFKI